MEVRDRSCPCGRKNSEIITTILKFANSLQTSAVVRKDFKWSSSSEVAGVWPKVHLLQQVDTQGSWEVIKTVCPLSSPADKEGKGEGEGEAVESSVLEVVLDPSTGMVRVEVAQGVTHSQRWSSRLLMLQLGIIILAPLLLIGLYYLSTSLWDLYVRHRQVEFYTSNSTCMMYYLPIILLSTAGEMYDMYLLYIEYYMYDLLSNYNIIIDCRRDV